VVFHFDFSNIILLRKLWVCVVSVKVLCKTRIFMGFNAISRVLFWGAGCR